MVMNKLQIQKLNIINNPIFIIKQSLSRFYRSTLYLLCFTSGSNSHQVLISMLAVTGRCQHSPLSKCSFKETSMVVKSDNNVHMQKIDNNGKEMLFSTQLFISLSNKYFLSSLNPSFKHQALFLSIFWPECFFFFFRVHHTCASLVHS